MNPSTQVVFFDVGRTLLTVRGSVGEVYAEVGRRHGVDCSVEDLELRFRHAWKRSLARSRERGHVCDDAILRREWRTIVAECFGGELDDTVLSPLFDELYERFATADAWDVAPRARETLEYLASQGVTLGVLSNWDARLRTTLDSLSLADYFRYVVASYEVGVEKPHERIFRAALDCAQTLPERFTFLGDSLEADMEPALRLGLRAIWFGRAPNGHAVSDAKGLIQLVGFPQDPQAYWDCVLAH